MLPEVGPRYLLSRFRTNIVSQKLPTINKWFSDFAVVADYDDAELKQILSDPNMIKFEDKARVCIHSAANSRKSLISRRRSLHDYVASFKAQQSSDNWRRLKNDLRTSFALWALLRHSTS